MSRVALLLYGVFVFFMLRLDRRQSPEVSFAFWIPTIWMLMVFSKPLGIWLGSGAETIEEGSKVDAAFLLFLLCSGVTVLLKRRFNWSKAMGENPWLIALLSFMLISCLWSNSDSFISLKRWSRELIAIVMAFVVASELHPHKSLEVLFRRIIYILIPLSPILINYFPEYGRIYVHHSGDLMWTGATMHKNQLAQLCIFALFFLIWTISTKRQVEDATFLGYQKYVDASVIILALWCIGGPGHSPTYSATATIAFLVGLATFIGLLRCKHHSGIPGRHVFAALSLIILIYGTVTPLIGKLSLIDVTSAVGREQNLTGRSDVWQKLVPAAMQRPILGYGFGGFWTTNARALYDISDSHNGYLGLILHLGFVGLVLYAMFILSSIRQAHRVLTQDFDWGVLWIGFLIIGLLVNITESSFTSFTSRLLSVVLFIMVSHSRSQRRTAQNII